MKSNRSKESINAGIDKPFFASKEIKEKKKRSSGY